MRCAHAVGLQLPDDFYFGLKFVKKFGRPEPERREASLRCHMAILLQRQIRNGSIEFSCVRAIADEKQETTAETDERLLCQLWPTRL